MNCFFLQRSVFHGLFVPPHHFGFYNHIHCDSIIQYDIQLNKRFLLLFIFFILFFFRLFSLSNSSLKVWSFQNQKSLCHLPQITLLLDTILVGDRSFIEKHSEFLLSFITFLSTQNNLPKNLKILGKILSCCKQVLSILSI